MNARTALRLGCVVGVSALVLTACSGGGDTGGAASDPITIGISLPLTGDFSEPGKGVQRGYEAWAETSTTRAACSAAQVELKILDDQSNADRVVADYEQLIGKDQVDLVFGPFSTRLVVPAAPGSPRSTACSSSSRPAPPRRSSSRASRTSSTPHPRSPTTTTTTSPSTSWRCPRAQRPKTAAYAAMDDPFAQGTAYGLKDKLEAAGIKTVVDEVYPPNTTDFGIDRRQDRRLARPTWWWAARSTRTAST